MLNATIGWLVAKGRDVTAIKLKEGYVSDQKIHDLIVREVKDIKTKLDGITRNDLLTAVDSFETGIRFLYQALDAISSWRSSAAELAQVTTTIKRGNDDEFCLPSYYMEVVKTVSVAVELGNIELTKIDETTKSAFYQARRRFETSREKATDASNNEALKTFDRITAIRYRVMAAVLQSVVEKVAVTDDLSSLSLNSALENALPECEQCLQKIHSLPAVQESFKVELEKRLRNIKGLFGKDERREIISTVCQINRTTYTATQAVGKVWVWPFIDTGEDKVDPLRDERVRRVLHKIDIAHCSITPWSIGGAGEVKHELKDLRSIATNIYGAILLVDNGDKTVKEFDKKGNLCLNFTPQSDDAYPSLDIHDVATDNLEDKICLLISVNKPGAKDWDWKWEVQVFNKSADLQHKFPLRKGGWSSRMTFSGGKVLVLRRYVVNVYKETGGFILSFGEGLFTYATDITSAKDGCVLIRDSEDSSVYLFTEEGQQLHKFNINIKEDYYSRIACHPAGSHFVLAGRDQEANCQEGSIYSKEGEFLRRIQLDEEMVHWLGGVTVTMEGHIAVVLTHTPDEYHNDGKVVLF